MPTNPKIIADLEDYYAKLQRLEIGLSDPENNPINDVILQSVTKKSLYLSGAELVAMRDRLLKAVAAIAKKSGSVGQAMSGKAIDEWLTKEEQSILTAKQLSAVTRMTDREAGLRLKVYQKKMVNEVGVLQSDMETFLLNAAASGRTKQQALEELMRASLNGDGIIQKFQKNASKVAKEASLREAQASAIAQYREVTPPDALWTWVAVSVHPCPDCEARAGNEMTYSEWVDMGLPGSGRTICMNACRCQLVPSDAASELFDDVRSFTWDKENLVLTTAAEARQLE
jgi:hypothetical protein